MDSSTFISKDGTINMAAATAAAREARGNTVRAGAQGIARIFRPAPPRKRKILPFI